MIQTNATLTAVTGGTVATGGTRDDWDGPGLEPVGAGAVKWTGSADAYYRQTTERRYGPDGVTVVPVRELIIDSSVCRAAGIDTDDVVTFIDPGGVARKATATSVRLSELAGMGAVQTAKLTLSPG